MSKVYLLQAALLGVAGIALSALAPSTAIAQTATSAAASSEAAEQPLTEAVVTGTFIRDIAPVGANLIGLSPQDITAVGANDMQQLLSSMPQALSFNNLYDTEPALGVNFANTRVPIARPDFRNLPGCSGASSGACVLILVDGHRIVPEGIQQTASVPDVVPVGIVDHVETILDGSSAIYGSDAVGGVINFITKKNFDGISFDAHYGTAPPGYNQEDATLTAGHSWDSGSLIFTYSFGLHSALYDGSRSYTKNYDAQTGVLLGHSCNTPNLVVGGVNYPEPGLVADNPALPGNPNTCDLSGFNTLYPSEQRQNGFLTMTQNVTDHITFNLEALYSYNAVTTNGGPFTGSNTVTPRNPYYQQVPGVAAGAAETVEFSYQPIFGNEPQTYLTTINAGQVTPTLTIDVGDWQIRTLYSFGNSITAYNDNTLNATLPGIFISGPSGSAAAIPLSAAIDPYNLTATSNQALFGGLTYQNRGNGVYDFQNARSVADGKLFALPGGDVHAAVGVEYQDEAFKTAITNTTTTELAPDVYSTVAASSVFGELLVPIVGKGNGAPGIEVLTLDASGRYDHYADCCGRFDPKISLNYNPVTWIAVRANWGESFNAPTPADLVGEAEPQVLALGPLPPNFAFAGLPPGVLTPPGALSGILYITGTAPGIKPQTASSWSIGSDVHPPVVPNLTLSATYYHIIFDNQITLPTPTGSQLPLFENFPSRYDLNLAGVPVAQINQFLALAPATGPAAYQILQASGARIIELLDGETGNLYNTRLAGLDFSASYNHPVSFGSVDVRFSGNYQFERETQGGVGPVQNDLYYLGFPDLNYQVIAGTTIQNFRAQVTWNHTSGYAFLPETGINLQSSVGAFDDVDLFFRWDVNGAGLAKDLAISFAVNNVANATPPVDATTTGSQYDPNILTLGRMYQFGVTKKF